jgi:CPA2 family monovalent cation:H+ antiporter-2
MSELPILRDLVLVIAACLAAVYVLRRAGIPALVSFILAGILVGPGCLNLIRDTQRIEILAQIGVIFLLFSVGLRISLEELFRLRWLVLGAGALQVGLTIAAAAAIVKMAGVQTPKAIFLGFLAAQSSTAVVLRLIESREEADSPHGQLMLGVAIFQDLAVIPLMLLIPVLGRAEQVSWVGAVLTLAKSFGLVIAIILAARFIIPWILERVVHTRSREVFTFAAILIALGTAYLSEQAGLSLALGAFVAGLVISESQYSHQVLAEVGAIRDALASLFFVSIGMLLDPRIWLAEPGTSVGLIAGVICLKTIVVAGIALVFGLGPRVAVLAGLGLAQVGEFSFILASAAAPYGFLEGRSYQQFLSVSVMTMMLSPLAVMAGPALSEQVQRSLRLARAWRRGLTKRVPLAGVPGARQATEVPQAGASAPQFERHVIIVGYGVNGRNVARVLRQMKVRFVVLELNPITVQSVRRQAEPVIYGDATQHEILRKAGIEAARVLIVAIADPRAARQIVAVARGLAPRLTIIVRTRFVAEVQKLRELGADEVVPEEFETSIALVGRVMAIYGASGQMIEREEEILRGEQYEALREDAPRALRSPALREMLAHADFAEVALPADSPAVGKSLKDLDLRGRTGASVMGISRDRAIIGNPAPEFVLQAGDVLGVLGSSAEVAAARGLLRHGGPGVQAEP